MEHIVINHDYVSPQIPSTSKNHAKRGATRHCCYGLCKSDSRQADREHMQGVGWIPFPKPHLDLDKCKRWVHACRRDHFNIDKVTKWTYMCTKHFVGGGGPTADSPDPIPASYTLQQVRFDLNTCNIKHTEMFGTVQKCSALI